MAVDLAVDQDGWQEFSKTELDDLDSNIIDQHTIDSSLELCNSNENNVLEKFLFDSLVLSGGGVKGIAHLGVIDYYKDQGRFSNEYVKEYVGTSVGSIICTLLMCDYTPWDIFSCIYKQKFAIPVLNIMTILQDFGLFNIDSIIECVREMIMTKYEKIPTMLELYQLTGKKLTITTTNISTYSPCYISYITKPDLDIMTAIKMSCSIPLIFKRIDYQGEYFVDGGIVNNFPIDQVSRNCNNTLGIVLIDKQVKSNNDNILSFIYKLSGLSVRLLTEKSCIDNEQEILVISLDDIFSFDFGIEPDKKMDLLSKGYNIAKLFDSRKYIDIEV